MGRLVSKISRGESTVVELSVEGGVYRTPNGLLHHNCDECRQVHLLEDGMTPRCWLHSEVSGSYHVRGEDRPSWHRLHPNCRCSLSVLLPGFGFDAAGRITYIRDGWSERDYQLATGGAGGVDARRRWKLE